MPVESQCIFCRIVRGEAEAHVVYRDARVVSFLDLHPVTRGHLLVVPRTHAADLAALEARDATAMILAGKRLAAALRRSLGAEGVNLLLADGTAAGQSVFHAHLHVIPRTSGDGFGFRRPLGEASSTKDDLTAVAGAVRAEVGEAA